MLLPLLLAACTSPELAADGLRARFSGEAARVEVAGRELVLSVDGLGRAELRGAPGAWEGAQRRTPGLTEVWRATPEGLEHTLDLHERPEGEGPARIRLRIDGAMAVSNGAEVAFADADGPFAALRDPRAWDARGAALPIGFLVEDGSVTLQIDDRGATWPLHVDPLLTPASVTITGLSGQRLGQVLAAAGDVDHNLHDDLLSASRDAAPSGKAYLWRADANGVPASPSLTLTPSGAADAFGAEAFGDLDINRDGFDDLVVSPGAGAAAALHVYLGSPSGPPAAPSQLLSVGSTVRGVGAAGDVDGDGFDDLVVSLCAAQQTLIYRGTAAGFATAPLSTSTSGAPGAQSCPSAGVGDVNHDGFDDVVVGNPDFSTTGRWMLFLGSAAGLAPSPALTVPGTQAARKLGATLAALGDVNGDTHPDLAVTAPNTTTNDSTLHVWLGNGASFPSAPSLSVQGAAGALLWAVDGAGDVDADGFADLIYGTRFGAAAQVLHGSAAGLRLDNATTLTGDPGFAAQVAGAGDVNHDGRADVLVGQDAFGGGQGRIWLFYGLRDDDRDGWAAGSDCNDADATIHPAATERAGDGVDQDCNGAELCLDDDDDDGFLDASGDTRLSPDPDCDDPSEALATAPTTDCNDASASIFPGATEVVDDRVDQDCSGGDLCWRDADDDSWRPDATATVASADLDCTDPGEGVTLDRVGDCNDADPLVRPGSGEPVGDEIDGNCDGAELCYADLDRDGFVPLNEATILSADTDCADPGEQRPTAPRTDCDDNAAAVRPGAPELTGTGVDENCDGAELCYLDADDDGHRPNGTATRASVDADCVDAGEALATEPAVDCNDAVPTTFPGAPELPGDNVDADCTGGELCFADADNDGFRPNATATVPSADADCLDNNEAVAADPTTDCNDTSAAIRPGATETVGDGVDQDCSGGDTCYADADDDGFRPNATATVASADADCADPFEAVAADPTTDCLDTDPAVKPGTLERAGDEVDQNCDGRESCFDDDDNDGFLDTTDDVRVSTDLDCDDANEGLFADPRTDCNDAAAAIYPGAPEVPGDTIDQDCDLGDTCYADADNDGLRATALTTVRSVDMDCTDPGEALNTDPATDCGDTDPAVLPGATELAGDEVDQNCDGREACFDDDDDDGHIDDTNDVRVSLDIDCRDANEALISDPRDDCNDAAATIYGGAPEIVGDGIDQSCDTLELCWDDDDRDGFLDTSADTRPSGDLDCADPNEAPANTPTTDCDDNDAAFRPGATELPDDGRDQDCSGGDLCFADADDDGFRPNGTATTPSADLDCLDAREARATDPTTDCDDSAATTFPGAPEVTGDERDQDCDGAELCFLDDDLDGLLPASPLTLPSADVDCDDPNEAAATAPRTDCDDTRGTVRPGAAEITGSGVDENCDGVELCFLDADDDGHRPNAGATRASTDGDCADAGEALAAEPADDCNDAATEVYPGAPELVGNGVDNDCQGGELCWLDADDDGFRPPGGATRASADADCADANEATAADPATDCNDLAAAIRPTATELPGDGVDQNCDGTESCYADADNDGYRPDATSLVPTADADCTDPGEALSTDPTTDCNDNNPEIFPGVLEIAGDAVDQNCDGRESCFEDDDDDGFLDSTDDVRVSTDLDCADALEGMETDPRTDCDDTRAAVRPGAAEVVADGVDQDCDGGDTCWRDADDDGVRPPSPTTTASLDLDCADAFEATSADPTTDCDDSAAAIRPGAAELPGDEVDQDCDGAELCFEDDDGDGQLDTSGDTRASTDLDCDDAQEGAIADGFDDCNDLSPVIFGGAPELPVDGIDQDCDGGDDCYADADDDGFRPGPLAVTKSADLDCADPFEAAALEPTTDCDDADAAIRPGATELVADEVDQDCDGRESCYLDADADGHRPNPRSVTNSADPDCADPGEAVAADPTDDCDDSDATVFPGATERVADMLDEDCDGAELCWLDADGDGHRPDATSTTASGDLDCLDFGEADDAAPADDCDDLRSGVQPGAVELVANGVDEDCDRLELCFADLDDDGFRPVAGGVVSSDDLDCEDPTEATAATAPNDCDDAAPGTFPGAPEIVADGIDQDCDLGDLCWRDGDGDGVRGPEPVASGDLRCDDDREADASVPAGDCDDADPAVRPGAAEQVADGVDQDCDVRELCAVDADSDGWRPAEDDRLSSADLDCADAGEATLATPVGDCDDADDAARPGATELPADGADQDCDGAELCFVDADDDGWRPNPTAVRSSPDLACDAPGEATAADPVGDCDDALAAVSPGAVELPADSLDQDCDGQELCFVDDDRDGWRSDGPPALSTDLRCQTAPFTPASTPTGDCRDDQRAIHPGVAERCDTVDEDCDGVIDDGVQVTLWADLDQDGWGDDAAPYEGCAGAPGFAIRAGDCAPADPDRHPGVADPCDEVDQDCDGDVDEDGATIAWYPDADRDGHGDGALALSACAAPDGYVAAGDDCDDDDATQHPTAPERCNGRDDDCDRRVDEDVLYRDWYPDADEDGWGVVAGVINACDPPAGYVPAAGDCDDDDGAVHPERADGCNGVDDDCDLAFDEDAVDADLYRDADGDGWGDPLSAQRTCERPEGWVERAGDCDDAHASTFPGALEVCNTRDDDCDQVVDEGAVAGLWYEDGDGDGFGGPTSQLTCAPPAGWVPTGGDCDDGAAAARPGGAEVAGDGIDGDCDGAELCLRDEDRDGATAGELLSADGDCADPGEATAGPPDCDDGDAAVFPGATELCNGDDDDCDGRTDDGLQLRSWYPDRDDDGYGDASTAFQGCEAPAGTVSDARDCDDDAATTYPGAFEAPGDGVDSDCDGGERCLEDDDGDGFASERFIPSLDADCADPGEALAGLPMTDCHDDDGAVFPGAPELCNGQDDDCDARADEDVVRLTWYADADGDSYGDPSRSQVSCTTPPGAVLDGRDCDDDDAAIHPEAEELPGDGVDQDCDGGERCYVDDDDDGWRTPETRDGDLACTDGALAAVGLDCDDARGDVFPGAFEEPADGADGDCDGTERCYLDADADGFRPDERSTVGSADLDCFDLGEAVAAAGTGDCDDADAATYPGAPETQDGVDSNCDLVGDDHDEDGDGLVDLAETGCTDPLRADTDGDGLDDGEELGGLGDPCAPDADADGLDDPDEASLGTDPFAADTDGDGLDDAAEVSLGTSPTAADTDDDGLDDGEEAAGSTSPLLADTDEDGLADPDELAAGTDPTSADSDGDALPDGAEISLGTDPLDADTDLDGVSDGDEVDAGRDPLGRDEPSPGDKDPGDGDAEGCGCRQSPPISPWLTLLLLVSLRRRARPAKLR